MFDMMKSKTYRFVESQDDTVAILFSKRWQWCHGAPTKETLPDKALTIFQRFVVYIRPPRFATIVPRGLPGDIYRDQI